MNFSNPNDKETQLHPHPDNTDVPFFALGEDGHVYTVVEYMVTDKRKNSNERLVRYDADTGSTLLNTPLYVLPSDYDGDSPDHWVMLNMIKMMERIEALEYEIEMLHDQDEFQHGLI